MFHPDRSTHSVFKNKKRQQPGKRTIKNFNNGRESKMKSLFLLFVYFIVFLFIILERLSELNKADC